MAVGSPLGDSYGNNAGAVYIFEKNGALAQCGLAVVCGWMRDLVLVCSFSGVAIAIADGAWSEVRK